MKRIISCLIVFVIVANCLSGFVASAKTTNYCIKATPSITNAAYNYMNEIYIKKYPELALEYSFGSEKDKKVLKNLANKITSGLTTQKQKTDAIVNWVSEKIEYKSYSTDEAEFFAIDTYYSKKGNCLGMSQLIVQLCRLCNIKAVMCCGTRGDMKNYVSLDNREPDHAWAMIYYDGNWRLYDPLFAVYGKTDKDFIARWYFTDLIEGISPYVEKYSEYFNYGSAIFYIDGRFIHYSHGMPASEYYKMGAEGGTGVNGSIPYFTKNRYDNKHGTGYDGFEYVKNPSRKDSMINDECYSNGWVTYGSSLYYAKANGILAGSTLKTYNGECYFLPYGSSAVKLPGTSNDYSITRGFPTLIKGTKIKPDPIWAEEEIQKGKVIVWKSETPETLSVSSNGTVTALSDGYGLISVCSKDKVNGDTHYYFSYIEFWVSSKQRTVKYSLNTNISKLSVKLSNTSYTYNGKVKTPTVVIKNSSDRVLKNGTAYTLEYDNGRKNAGTYKVKVKMKGHYSGTKTLTFKIKPVNISKCKLKLTDDAYTYNGKVKTPTVVVKNANGTTLKKNKDYTVTYAKGRKNIGKYKVTIKMRGNYTGTKTLYFTVKPKPTSMKSLTAESRALKVKINRRLTQNSGYQIQYSRSKSFKDYKTKSISDYKKNTVTLTGLKSKATYYVRVRTYKTVNGKKYYSNWSDYMTKKTK